MPSCDFSRTTLPLEENHLRVLELRLKHGEQLTGVSLGKSSRPLRAVKPSTRLLEMKVEVLVDYFHQANNRIKTLDLFEQCTFFRTVLP